MDSADWTLLSVVIEGEALEIDGTNVWWHEWRRLDIGTLEVPHPSYPHQTHALWPYAIEPGGGTLVFCAGELSNGVWCFHVPAKGQPGPRFKGMTVNERLYEAGLLESFGLAIDARNEKRATDLLIAAGLGGRQAAKTAGTVLANPEAYGIADRTDRL